MPPPHRPAPPAAPAPPAHAPPSPGAGSGVLAVPVLLTALIMVSQLATSLYLPALPRIAVEFATSEGAVKQTMASFFVGFAVGQLVYGPLTDRFGRRRVLLVGMGLYALTSLGCALAPDIGALTLARFLQAATCCSAMVVCRAVVRDLYPRERGAQVLAYMGMAIAVAPALGPVIGAQVLILSGWRTSFVLLAVLALLLGALVWRRLPETLRFPDPHALHPSRMLANYATLLRSRVYLGHLLGAGFVFSALFTFVTAGPFVFISRLGLSEMAFSLLSVVTVAGFMAGSFSAARLTQRVGLERMALAGAAVTALSGLVMLGLLAVGLQSVPSLLLPMVGVVFGMGWVFPNSQAGAIAPFPQIAGSASALLGFGQMGMAALILTGLALIPEGGGAWPMVVTVAACGVLAFVVLAMLVWPSRQPRARGG